MSVNAMSASIATPGAGDSEASLCPICGAHSDLERAVADDRYGYPGVYRMLRCGNCGHRHADSQLSPDELTALYTDFYPRTAMDVEQWRPHPEHSRLAAWWRGARSSAYRWVPRNARVLDIGCGFGESLGYHRDRGCDAHGVEADANILRVAARHGLQVRHGLFDPDAYEAESFDYVTLDQVIEHVASPLDVLRGVRRVLRSDGRLVLSTPNADGFGRRAFGRRWIHWHAPYHLQFFSAESMRLAAAAAGLEVVGAHTVTPSAWLTFQWAHLAAYPSTGERSVFWGDAARRSFAQRWTLRALAVFGRLGVNALLTRLLDLLGFGDNRVYVLRPSPAVGPVGRP